jgi:hypothetical protein
MDVFLVPVAPARFSEAPVVLYCEPPPDPVTPEPGAGEPRPSLFARMVAGFKQALAEGEAEQRRQERGDPPSTHGSRISRLVKRKLAEAVAEQRLLWHLRHVTAARLIHADTMTSERAIALATAEFTKDFSKHRLWCVIDTAIAIVSILLALVPGPNLLGYYFVFRAVGHLFSLRGARKGREASLWTAVPSPPLSELQEALNLPGPERDTRVDAIGATLGLERLTYFVRRMARVDPAA